MKDAGNRKLFRLIVVVWAPVRYSFHTCFLTGIPCQISFLRSYFLTLGKSTISLGGRRCNAGRDCSYTFWSCCNILKKRWLGNICTFLFATLKACNQIFLIIKLTIRKLATLTSKVGMGASSCAGNMREMVKVWWFAKKLKYFNLSWKV